MRVGWYDGDLHMFVEPRRDPKRSHLLFLRWLAENFRLEHSTCGPPGGEFAEPASWPGLNRTRVPRWFGR